MGGDRATAPGGTAQGGQGCGEARRGDHARMQGARAGFPDRRHDGRRLGRDDRRLRDGPRRFSSARQVAAGGPGQGHLEHRRHRDPLPGAEVEADREDRRAAGRPQAAAAGGRARRERGGHPRRAGAEEPHGRSRPADGIAVQAHRAGDALPAQHERAVARQGAERPLAEERARRNGWSTARTFWSAAPGIGSARSRGGSKSSAAI